MNLKKEIKIVHENHEKCIEIIEQSFLKKYFSETLTDIQYNGSDFFGQDNELGRYKLDITISNEEVFSILCQLANYALKPFSSQYPILDIAFGNYRLSAMHPSLARNNNEKVATFSIRKIQPSLKIKDNDKTLCPSFVFNLLTILIKNYQSIIISGLTGSGKTELQKYLISKTNMTDRIILIEDSYETYIKEIYPQKDITSWIINSQNQNLSLLIKTSLRHNPDWIIVAETRGAEAFEMIQSISTGHPIITTIHSDSASNSLHRLIKMIQKSIEFNEKNMLQDVATYLKIGVHIRKQLRGKKIVRNITEVVEYIPTSSGYKTNYLYQLNENNLPIYHPMSEELYQKIQKNKFKTTDISVFIPKEEVDE